MMSDAGRAAYRGFNYQIHVSVWLMLDLVATGSLSAIVIEPLGGEDAAVLLRNSEANPGERGVSLVAGQLLIQIKSRERGHWTAGDVLSVLKGEKGDDVPSTTRVRPLAELTRDPEKRFLFVTTTQLAPQVAAFKVDSSVFGARDVRLDLGADWAGIPAEIFRRFGVFEQTVPELIASRTDLLLAHHFKVPKKWRTACTNALVARVREGLLEHTRSRITEADIHHIAKAHGGEPLGPEVFVHHASFTAHKAKLERDHVLVLLGPVGIGKTTAARGLAFEYARDDDPFLVLYPKTPSELGEASRSGERLVALVDDPFDPALNADQTRQWAQAIQRFGASVERKLIVTSRHELLPTSSRGRVRVNAAADYLRQHACVVTEESYDRRALLRAHLERATRNQLAVDWLSAHEGTITKSLSLPIHFATLVERASFLAEGERDFTALKVMIEAVRNATLTRDLERAFTGSNDPQLLGLSALLLVLRMRRGSYSMLQQVEEDLRDTRAEVLHVARTLRRFGWLEIAEDGRVWTNSARMDAMEDLLHERPVLRALCAEAAILNATYRNDAELVLALRKASQPWLRVRQHVSREVGEALERWLIDAAHASLPEVPPDDTAGTDAASARTKRARRFPQFLAQLAADGIPTSPLVALARALAPPDSEETAGNFGTIGFESWEGPAWSDSLRRRITSEPEVAAVVRAFVRHHLPSLPTMASGAEALVNFLYGLADVGGDFLEAAARIDEVPSFAAEVIASGAVRAKNADLDKLLACALNFLTKADAWYKEAAADIDDDSQAACEHFGDQHYEQTRGANVLIDAILREHAARGSVEWTKNPSAAVVDRYAESLKYSAQPDARAVARVLDELSPSDVGRVLVEVARQPEFTEIVLETIGKARPDTWGVIAERLLGREHAGEMLTPASTIRDERVRLTIKTLLRVLAPLGRVVAARSLVRSKRLTTWHGDVLEELSAEELSVVRSLEGASDKLGGAPLELLLGITNAPTDAAPDGLRALHRQGRAVDEWFRWISEPDRERALAVVDVAKSMPPETSAPLLLAALHHSDHQVRKASLKALVSFVQDEATTATIVRLALTDPTTSVRQEALASLARNASAPAREALLAALEDPKDTSDDAQWGYPGYGDEPPNPEYGIAAAAAAALADQRPFPPELRSRVEAFLGSNKTTARDRAVREYLQQAPAGEG